MPVTTVTKTSGPLYRGGKPASPPDDAAAAFAAAAPEPSRNQLWFAAVKPPMYTVAISPITVGSLAAAADTAAFSAPRMLVFVLAAVGIIAWTNLTNDVFDFDTGIDMHKRESVVNLLGATRAARNRVLLFANVLLAASLAAVAAISTTVVDPSGALALDPVVPSLIFAAVALGYMYQGPGFRLGYLGLGEPICFSAWTLGVCAAYYSQLSATRDASSALRADFPSAIARLRVLLTDWPFSSGRSLGAAALLVACPTTLILLCSHFHQIDDDRAAGKRSPVVRLGTLRASYAVAALVAFTLAAHAALLATGRLPLPVFLAALPAARFALRTAAFVRKHHDVPSMVRPAKYHAVVFHFVHGTLVALGFAFVALRNIWSA